MYFLLEINLSKKHLQRAGAFILFFLTIFLMHPLVAVPDGHAGIIISRGKVEDQVISEGMHLRLPAYQQIVNIDCRPQQMQMQVPLTSRDLQTVNALLSIHYHINPSGVAKLYRQKGTAYESTLLTPVIQESLQTVVMQYSTEEMLFNRSEIINKSSQLITRSLSQHNIVVDKFNIMNFEFSTQSNLVYL
ncbi:MAG: prohibitin family protein [Syntrophomonadaceae bacterium]|nr:prohibitin family protein [Syntrophomonadaceae bacterium]